MKSQKIMPLNFSLTHVCFFAVLLCTFHSLLLGHKHSYRVTNLISDIPGAAEHYDPLLHDPWGLIFDSKGHLITANNRSDTTTSYDRHGEPNPNIIHADFSPTSLVRNFFHRDFKFSSGSGSHSKAARYLLATEYGTILAYNKDVDPDHAIVVIDRSSHHAKYTGIAIAIISKHQFLYATDFHNGRIDVFNRFFEHVGSFPHHHTPEGYAPFNIQHIKGRLYVTYAKRHHHDHRDFEPGHGHGLVNVFNLKGELIKQLISHSELDAPWGIALAPKHFAHYSKALLIGNRGDGRINAYDHRNGDFLGTLLDEKQEPIEIHGLWSLVFKRHHRAAESTLYFTAGPHKERKGLLGYIYPHHEYKNTRTD